ncbi:MAG: site-specific integrase [Proteobacteria bacterium]|jgi:integrase|nr:MAG: site-specific integrase [Pseudomonadota bacterium]
MAVKSYEKDGKSLWMVYVNVRHPTVPGVRKQSKIKGLKTESAALQEEKKLLQRLTSELMSEADLGPTWGEVVNAWELDFRSSEHPEIARATFDDHLSLLRRWTAEFEDVRLKEMGRAEVKHLLKRIEREQKSRSFTIKLKAGINRVFNWAIDEGRVKGVVVLPTESLKVGKWVEDKPPEILNIEEIRLFLSEAKKLEHPWYPIWAVALLTGMRSGELQALLWTDLDFTKSMITVSKSFDKRTRLIKTTKAGYWRNVPMSDELKSFLLKLRKSNPGVKNVLPQFNVWKKGEQARVIRAFCKGMGLPSIRFHTLRACFATQLLANNIAPARVMKICGWKDLKTMERYVRLAGIDERGATDTLKLGTDEDAMAEVIDLFKFKADR